MPNSKANNSYGHVVANARYGRFLILLARWRSSIYKMLYRDLLVFCVLYLTLTCVYFFALNDSQKRIFEAIAAYCQLETSLIPMSFFLGFYTGICILRWWKQYMSTPWPDPIAVFVSCLVHGSDTYGRVMRRTVMRYVCLTLCLVMIDCSPPVKKRFRSYEKLIESGMLMASEAEVFRKLDEKFPKVSKHWMPIAWACSVLVRGRSEGRIRDDFALRTLVDNLNTFRYYCHQLLHYNFISIPLVYTQVITLAVYSYFFACLMGRQYIPWHGKKDETEAFNMYFPIFPLLEFFFYVGWLKVAEVLICPFGEDDQDYDVLWLITRNLQVCYIIVDEMYHKHPDLLKDQYWDSIPPETLPYPTDIPSQHLLTAITSIFTRSRVLAPQSSVEMEINRRMQQARLSDTLSSSSSLEYEIRASDYDPKTRKPAKGEDGEDAFDELKRKRKYERYARGTYIPQPVESDSSYEIIGPKASKEAMKSEADISEVSSGLSVDTLYASLDNVSLASEAPREPSKSRVTIEDVSDESDADNGEVSERTLEDEHVSEEEDEEIKNILAMLKEYEKREEH